MVILASTMEAEAHVYLRFSVYSQTSKIRAPPSTGQLICPILSKIVGSTVGVAYYSLCIYIVFRDTDKSELRAPPNPKVPG